MFGSTPSGANAYAKVGMETGVIAASPHKLIVMLFDGALAALATALHHMKTGNIPGKGQAISKAIAIIDSGLRASLDHKVGGEIAQSLDALYEYMSNRLLVANLQNQPEIIEEVQRLLQDLKDAWEAIKSSAAQPTVQPQVPAYGMLSPDTSSLVKA
jgi:flagellar protein FliS